MSPEIVNPARVPPALAAAFSAGSIVAAADCLALYIPPHAAIAAACGVSVAAVKRWSSGVDAVAHHHLVAIADSDPRVSLAGLTRLWVARWRAKHPEAR